MVSSSSLATTQCYARLISLGRHCQPAYQIRRFTGDRRSYYFDWVASPHDGLVNELRTGFAESFKLSNLSISEDGATVSDSINGFTYRHAFPRTSLEVPLDWTAVVNSYAEVRAKVEMLKHRWLVTVRNDNTLFIRHDNLSEKQILELYEALLYQAHGNKVGLLIAHPQQSIGDISDPHIHVECGFPMPTGRIDWKGDDSQWDALLSKYWIRDKNTA